MTVSLLALPALGWLWAVGVCVFGFQWQIGFMATYRPSRPAARLLEVAQQQPLEQARNDERFLEELTTRAKRIALHITRDPTVAEDIAQKAALISWKTLPEFRDLRSFDAWLGLTVQNLVMQARTTTARVRELELDASTFVEHDPVGGESVLRSLAIEQAIGSLSDADRRLFSQRYVQGRSVVELEQSEGRAGRTLRQRLAAARAKVLGKLVEGPSSEGFTAERRRLLVSQVLIPEFEGVSGQLRLRLREVTVRAVAVEVAKDSELRARYGKQLGRGVEYDLRALGFEVLRGRAARRESQRAGISSDADFLAQLQERAKAALKKAQSALTTQRGRAKRAVGIANAAMARSRTPNVRQRSLDEDILVGRLGQPAEGERSPVSFQEVVRLVSLAPALRARYGKHVSHGVRADLQMLGQPIMPHSNANLRKGVELRQAASASRLAALSNFILDAFGSLTPSVPDVIARLTQDQPPAVQIHFPSGYSRKVITDDLRKLRREAKGLSP